MALVISRPRHPQLEDFRTWASSGQHVARRVLGRVRPQEYWLHRMLEHCAGAVGATLIEAEMKTEGVEEVAEVSRGGGDVDR